MSLRVKQMSKQEFEHVAELEWFQVNLSGEGIPIWMRGIPKEKLEYVLASGDFNNPRKFEENSVSFSGVVGEIDIIRRDPKDVPKGFPFNKDHYCVVFDPANNNALLVHEPFRDNEHCIRSLSNLPENIIVLDSSGY